MNPSESGGVSGMSFVRVAFTSDVETRNALSRILVILLHESNVFLCQVVHLQKVKCP